VVVATLAASLSDGKFDLALFLTTLGERLQDAPGGREVVAFVRGRLACPTYDKLEEAKEGLMAQANKLRGQLSAAEVDEYQRKLLSAQGDQEEQDRLAREISGRRRQALGIAIKPTPKPDNTERQPGDD
jgi:hypothetical protein